jgi:hypothetical protein
MVMDEGLQIYDKTWRQEETKMPTSTSSLFRMLGLQLTQKDEDEATGAALRR